jgi:hypothetical protein
MASRITCWCAIFFCFGCLVGLAGRSDEVGALVGFGLMFSTALMFYGVYRDFRNRS